ncbi:MAG: glycoside hydrolase family 88 protein [Candidatus Izemoplasmatales bacterium]
MDHRHYERAVALARRVRDTFPPKMKWMWGEALLGFSLARLDEHAKTDEFSAFLKAYCDHYAAHPPIVDQSDTAAPGLIAWAVAKKTGDQRHRALADKVLDYVRNEPRLIEDSVNHLGNSFVGKIYPKSIWVDSIMMFSVFPAIVARDTGDDGLMAIAARQPRVMAKYMMDPDRGLWYHSYWVRQKTHYPRRPIFWARGNAWVVAALPMILETVGNHPERATIEDVFRKTCAAVLPFQRSDGTFSTVLGHPHTYRELSATALFASGFLAGSRLGLLDGRYRDAGARAFEAVVGAFVETPSGPSLPEVSDPTIPLPLFPYLGYALVPRHRDWSYGIAATLFAAVEYDRAATMAAREDA